MTNLSFALVYATLLASGGQVEPAATTVDHQPRIEQIRMVCDQNCACWPTRYQGHQASLFDREDLACQTRRSGRIYYNGYYRQGPATGVGFESRHPVREFSFPF